MNRYIKSDKVAAPPLASKRLLDQVRERIRYPHHSLKTEKAYLYWVRFFVLWSDQHGGMRHPRDMGGADVEAFLTMLANERQAAPATHRQAELGSAPNKLDPNKPQIDVQHARALRPHLGG